MRIYHFYWWWNSMQNIFFSSAQFLSDNLSSLLRYYDAKKIFLASSFQGKTKFLYLSTRLLSGIQGYSIIKKIIKNFGQGIILCIDFLPSFLTILDFDSWKLVEIFLLYMLHPLSLILCWHLWALLLENFSLKKKSFLINNDIENFYWIKMASLV